MAQYAHKGQILPLVNQMIPIDKQTTFHASYDYHLNGMNQGDVVTTNRPSKAMTFSSGQYAKIDGLANILTNSSDFSISYWFRTTYKPSTVYGSVVFSCHDATGNSNIFRIGIGSTGGIYIDKGGDTEYGTGFADGNWHYLTFTLRASDGSTHLYVDNTEITGMNTSKVQWSNAKQYSIAQEYDGIYPSDQYVGDLADIRTYSVCVDNSTTNLTDPIGWWKLTETEGKIIYDSSTYNNNGILLNNAVSTYGPTVATIKKTEGKFGGAVLIEPDTVNLFTGEYSGSGGESFSNGWYKKIGTIGNFRSHVTLSSLVNGTTYSCSATVYNPNTSSITLNLDWCDSAVTGFSISPGETRRISITQSRATYDSTYRFFDISITTAKDVWIKDIQIESRDYPTSYVGSNGGSRPLGKLWYPKEIINPSAFTIGFWFKTPYMHRVSTNNAGLQGSWYHPILEIAPTVGTTAWNGMGVVAGPQPSGWNRRIGLYINSSFTQTNGIAIQDDTWYHISLVYDGSWLVLYVDGVPTDSIQKAPMTLSTNHVVMVGGGYMGKALGMIDELRIESRAISSDEVAAWAASGLHYNYLDYSQYVD